MPEEEIVFIGCNPVRIPEFETLPPVTEEEATKALTDEKSLSVSYFGTEQGKELLKRLYMSDQYSNADLAEIFRSDKDAIKYFVAKQGWVEERDQSRHDGEIAKRRSEMRLKADELKLTALSVISKGIDTMNTDYDGAMVVESAGKLRNLVQSIADISPSDEQHNPAAGATLNIGVVFTREND